MTRNMPTPSVLGSSAKDSARSDHIPTLIIDDNLLFHQKVFADQRGQLVVGEIPRDIPFEIKRYFAISQVPKDQLRGNHAHKKCHQFLVCLKGSVQVELKTKTQRQIFKLDSSDVGLYIPPMIWGTQKEFSQDAVLLVFASDLYDATDYINDFEDVNEVL